MTWTLIVLICQAGCDDGLRAEMRFWPFETRDQCEATALLTETRLHSRGSTVVAATCKQEVAI